MYFVCFSIGYRGTKQQIMELRGMRMVHGAVYGSHGCLVFFLLARMYVSETGMCYVCVCMSGSF